MADLDLLIKKYSIPLGKSMSQLNNKQLFNIELFHQEAIREKPEFKIDDFLIFDRPIEGNFPECSIRGDELYREEQLIEAYRLFGSMYNSSVNSTDIPTWSQGIYGMSLDIPNSTLPEINLIIGSLEKCGEASYDLSVGFNSEYFPYLLILCESLKDQPAMVNAVYCYDEVLDENILNQAKKIKNLRLFCLKTPYELNKRNKKGFYTLSRYFLANHLSGYISNPLVIIDIDAKVKNISLLDGYRNDYDIGVLDLKNYRRPWLKNTAPFVFINNDRGYEFLNSMVKKYAALIEDLIKGKNLSLWGVDQSVITSVLDINKIQKKPLRVFNFIKSLRFFMEQAQEFSTKSDFLSSNIVKKELILHIGSYQTNSASIQENLFRNSKILLDNNVNYLFNEDVSGVNENNGKQSFHVKKSIEELADYMRQAEGSIHILSDECFWHRLSRDKVIRAINLADIYTKVTIVGYLRRQDKFIESLYKQEQRSGLDYAAGKTVKDFIKELKKLNSLNFFDVIKPYEKINCEVEFIFRAFEKSVLQEENVVRDFFYINGINFDDIVFYDELNEFKDSVSSIVASLLWSFVNKNSKIRGLEDLDINSIEGREVLKLVRKYSQVASNLFTTDYTILGYDEKVNILNEYYESNKRFCQLYLIDKNSELYTTFIKENKNGIDSVLKGVLL